MSSAVIEPLTGARALEKILLGQFFTTTNPFANEAFVRWFKAIPGYKKKPLLEPFAGANNIVQMLQDLGFNNTWQCYDIAPINDPDLNPVSDQVTVEERDCLENFPLGFSVTITNPPYLAKNSATEKQLPFVGGPYSDVYLQALDVMLSNVSYVAAIIPESFITQGLFHERLHSVISLTCRMFEDTEVPVCLALFVPAKLKNLQNDFEVWSGSRFVARYSELRAYITSPGSKQAWRFNSPSGSIGLRGVDDQKSATIRFVPGGEIINPVKNTSRAVTRIELPGLTEELATLVIQRANELLQVRREQTQDIFMTAFKGLRKDGRYRRRLDFAQARSLLDIAYEQLSRDAQSKEAA